MAAPAPYFSFSKAIRNGEVSLSLPLPRRRSNAGRLQGLCWLPIRVEWRDLKASPIWLRGPAGKEAA
jgi:hypothetical protein